MARKHYNVTALAFLILHLTLGECTSDLIFQSNGNFTLQPNIKGILEDILWKFEGDKVVEYDQFQLIEYGSYSGRTVIMNLWTGALTLLKLQTSDSGHYTGELQINGKLHYYHQTVNIYDAVTKPAVTCQICNSMITLRCAGDQSPLTQYSWVGPEIQNKSGSELQLNNEDVQSSDAAIYTCVVKNPVSNRREDFDAKTCLPAPGSSSGIITVLIIVLILIAIVLGLVFIYYKKYCKRNVERQEKEFQKTLKGFSSENLDEHKNESECLVPPAGNVKRKVQEYEERGKGKTCLSTPCDER
ncbi:hypothetical protein AGOR_G00217280 [Albula goreensis]|uniref:Ig-like domain-containing protein n=1 Tax=Albula goreensis TaxID=1534307 RepID=A0A8T3CQY6_9TELE|nr:hypothetical protein AGOR_G00217280 [Albula goreensis]